MSSSGHLKIADFGLATSGDWIYQESYRSSRRKELLKKYHQAMVEDGLESTLKETTNPSHDKQPPEMKQEKLKRMHAHSIVGTYYYMAPEVLSGDEYNASADWYSTHITNAGGPSALSYLNASMDTLLSGPTAARQHKKPSSIGLIPSTYPLNPGPQIPQNDSLGCSCAARTIVFVRQLGKSISAPNGDIQSLQCRGCKYSKRM